ncbi:Alpha/Beta hydrolase protein [Multifurca ochricompacta]|uniref:Alpha/Beta hydrolase protein n=1 Tax=Multifurca ochricompacta TaxID=376703 RepID=A0AAD4MBZ5_9AGAM|nr:Alpha/Beta hydrolase protein [Multifurca ochricompacta]
MSQSNDSDVSYPPLTLREKLWLLPIIAKLPFAVAVGVFRENKGRSWSRAANIALTRYIFDQNWDPDTLRSFIGLTTSQSYQKWAHQVKQEVLTDVLPEGAKLHWLGKRRDARGGFVVPARAEYFPFLQRIQKDLSPLWVILELPSWSTLRQANAALTHLLQKGIPPSNIILGGDSAGGNLVLQLASHLLHPLSSIPPPPTLSQPLAGAVLISPWVSYLTDAPSYTRNKGKDLITVPPDWWSGLDGVCSRILITTGELECIFDQIIESSKAISQHVKNTTTVVEPGGVHEDLIDKFATGEGGMGKITMR